MPKPKTKRILIFVILHFVVSMLALLAALEGLAAFDVPDHFRVTLFQEDNPEATVFHSKAVGEPPLMLAISVWCALRDACRQPSGRLPDLAVPATPEQVYWAISGRAGTADAGGEA